MRIKDIEQRVLMMTGDQLLEELISRAVNDFEHQQTTFDRAAFLRAIQTRLAETGIARKYHGDFCGFMLGENRCSCSSAHWSWPRKGLDKPL